MPRNKGIGRKFKRKRDTSKPYLRPKGKQELETTDRAEEPCNVDSEDGGFFFPIAMMALVRSSMMRCVEVQLLLPVALRRELKRASLLKLHSQAIIMS